MTDVMINNVIDNLAAKLAVPVTEVYTAVQALGARDLIVTIILLVICLVAVIAFILTLEKECVFIVPLIIAVLSAFAMVGTGYNAILYLVSPKAYAINHILQLLTRARII